MLLPLLYLSACGSKPYPHAMQIADTLVYSNPDSAYTLLEQLKDSITTEPKGTQMYYRLLSIKAQDKAYMIHTSDSLILQVVHYYENKEDEKHLPEAYYYAGRVYSDLGDAPQALDYYQKAEELLEGSTNYRLLKVVYSQMGALFLFQDVYEEAIKAFKKAYQYNSYIKDDRGMILNLCAIGDAFTAFSNADSALFYYKQADQHAAKLGKKVLINKIKRSLVSLYTQLEQYDSAKAALESLDCCQLQNQTATCITIADLYYQMGEFDSATYYYNKLLQCDNIYAQQAIHWGLAKIAEQKSDCQGALNHIRQYNQWTDSIKAVTDSEAIRKMQSLYNYQLREKTNNQLKEKNAQQRFWISIAFCALSISSILFLIYFNRNKHKKLQLQNSLREMKRQKEEQYKKSSLFIEENKLKIEELEKELQMSYKNSTDMQKLLIAQKEQILHMNSKIEADQEEQSLAEIAFHQSEIYNKFRDAANGSGMPEAKDWEILRIKIDHCYKDFTARLRAIYPVSDIEMKICLLLKIGIGVTGIALLTGRTKSTIVSARKKLYEKTHGEVGKPEQWDSFILSL